MAQLSTEEQFDIDCLRLISTDSEARRVSLAAAMIKLHALTIARSDPSLRKEAMEIVHHLERLYAGLPNRAAVARVVRDNTSQARLADDAVEDVADAVWTLFVAGRN